MNGCCVVGLNDKQIRGYIEDNSDSVTVTIMSKVRELFYYCIEVLSSGGLSSHDQWNESMVTKEQNGSLIVSLLILQNCN